MFLVPRFEGLEVLGRSTGAERHGLEVPQSFCGSTGSCGSPARPANAGAAHKHVEPQSARRSQTALASDRKSLKFSLFT